MENKKSLTAPMRSTQANDSQVQHFIPEKEVCTKNIDFVVNNGSIDYVCFGGGCEGNLKAIASMIEGMSVDFVMDRFSGITCGSKSTSCVDQLCTALAEHMKKKAN